MLDFLSSSKSAKCWSDGVVEWSFNPQLSFTLLLPLFLADSSPSLAGLFPTTLLGKSRRTLGEESAAYWG